VRILPEEERPAAASNHSSLLTHSYVSSPPSTTETPTSEVFPFFHRFHFHPYSF